LNIGRADKLGSGVRNLYKYTKIYSGEEPELIEGDIFKTIVPLKGIGTISSTGDIPIIANKEELLETDDLSLPYGNENGNEVKKSKEAILDAIKKKPHITLDELVVATGKSKRSISRVTKEMQGEGLLQRIGSARAGHWKVIC
jgi:ATP-dependent DNA helicase RecG